MSYLGECCIECRRIPEDGPGAHGCTYRYDCGCHRMEPSGEHMNGMTCDEIEISYQESLRDEHSAVERGNRLAAQVAALSSVAGELRKALRDAFGIVEILCITAPDAGCDVAARVAIDCCKKLSIEERCSAALKRAEELLG